MKRLLLSILICCSFLAKGQVYNNEWIDFSKTYYKFKVSKTGLYRITQDTLSKYGLGSAQAEYFQLWRNGTQVPIYTSVAAGNFSPSDYIEFWGEMNDGKPDKALYNDPSYQLNDKWSLETDTAMYFLTLNAGGGNLRFFNTTNDVIGNVLAPEPYFMYTTGVYFKQRLNFGNAVHVDEQYLFSSTYDKGEGFTSLEMATNGFDTTVIRNLQAYTAGPSNINFTIALSGNTMSQRTYYVHINGDSVISGPIDFLNTVIGTTTFPVNILASDTVNVKITNMGERLVVHKYEFTYPRKFNFNGATNFEFTLPANASNSYLEISNFSYGSTAPVLYDITNGARYVMDVTVAPFVRVVLQPSAIERKLVLVSEEAGNITKAGEFKQRGFNNYQSSSLQGNYLIITNSILFNGANGSNPVEDYRAYRSSAIGGGFNAKIYLEDELIDQFGFGIRKNPLAIRNFIRFARNTFSTSLSHIFMIGKGVEYVYQRTMPNEPQMDRQNLVPTFGYPASDVLLSAEPGGTAPKTPIGRLSAVYPHEVADYLAKVKETEQKQVTLSPNFEDRGWMKNVIHLNGGGEPSLAGTINGYFNKYKTMISDSLFGGNVYTFTKQSAGATENAGSNFKAAFENGASLITYFGHSSTGALSYNLDEPQAYNNAGKYPTFIALGCNAGSIFSLDHVRLTKIDGISEKYVLAPERGVLNFIASSHFGIVHYLDIFNEQFYLAAGKTGYGKTIGELMKMAAEGELNLSTDYYSRANIEELILHGDPATKINTHAKPDYVVTDPLVKISPSFISVAETTFKLNAQFYNIGKAVNNPIIIKIEQKYPNGVTNTIYSDTIIGIRYTHSINIDIPIDPTRDIGTHKIIVTVDADNNVDEFFESNNSITKEFVIYEDEARPIYPYQFAIVNQPNTKLWFSTANPFSEAKQYKVEIDTTELFNSNFKISKSISSKGGAVEVDPGITLIDKTVYYWRVAIVPTNNQYKWNTSSFVYLQNHDLGFNQSHAYQHFKSTMQSIYLDSATRVWSNPPKAFPSSIIAPIGTFPYANEAQQSASLNGDPFMRSTCWFSSLVFNVFDAATNLPWQNVTITNANFPSSLGEGLYGSTANNCNFGRQNNFEYRYADTSSRRKMMDFMRDIIPNGSYVLVRNMTIEDYWGFPQAYASDWAADTTIHGSGQSLYHYLKNAGFADLDSFNRVRQWAFIYRKGDTSFTPKWAMTLGATDFGSLSADIYGLETDGHITSPSLGPSKKWKQLIWNGATLETPNGDNPRIDVIGVRKDKTQTILFSNIGLNEKTVDISTIDAGQYPNIKLHMHNTDSTTHTPYQLDYWRLTGDPVPEGALAPNIYLKMGDTVEAGQPIDFKIAFKNVSASNFDSLKVKFVITDRNNVQHIFSPTGKLRPLTTSPDTLHIQLPIDSTNKFLGLNTLYVEVNPDDDQPEQYHYNNFAFIQFYVASDTLNPLMDVTFDNMHILNNDIVSSRPEIVIKLKDESKWLLLNDTSIISVKIRYPGETTPRKISFNSDTLRFISAQSSSDNTATINFNPYFKKDGTYELIVTGKDVSNNKAGEIEYKIAFQVINKPMISNMLNYPNPFTTSTAFVFTITGSEVPQNIKIQILTITGKVVREITKDELGPLRIGRNITEFKWDGTDQYGQKLGNGVYLYRVVTNLNGKSLDKYTSKQDDTDKYFNKGYGKMYLMR